MNGLSVIIPSKDASNLGPCVDRIWQKSIRPGIIVVWDNDPWPGLNAPWTMPAQGPIQVIPGIEPFIFARNVNLGIRAAGRDDVVILNDDALLESTAGFTLLQNEAIKHPEYGIIGAVTNVTGQPLQYPRNIGLREVPHFAFVCVLIPRRTIDRVGLLDERYCLDYGCEDRDYCEAVTRAGLKVGVHDGCYVDHGSLTSTFRGSPRTPKSYAQNYELFKAKWGISA